MFCSHGAGVVVRWDEVCENMHLESVLKPQRTVDEQTAVRRTGNIGASDDELLKIFERTYGKVERKNPNHAMRTPKPVNTEYEYKPKKKKEFDTEYLLIDGYNIIFAWDYLKKLAGDSLEAARSALTDRISAYKIFRDCEIILVFDAYKVKGNPGEAERVNGITVVYTKEAQTADAYIEKAAKELSRNYKVTVATSDGLEQMIIFGSGAYRLPARALFEDVLRVENRVREIVEQYNIDAENTKFLRTIRDKMEELEMGIEE